MSIAEFLKHVEPIWVSTGYAAKPMSSEHPTPDPTYRDELARALNSTEQDGKRNSSVGETRRSSASPAHEADQENVQPPGLENRARGVENAREASESTQSEAVEPLEPSSSADTSPETDVVDPNEPSSGSLTQQSLNVESSEEVVETVSELPPPPAEIDQLLQTLADGNGLATDEEAADLDADELSPPPEGLVDALALASAGELVLDEESLVESPAFLVETNSDESEQVVPSEQAAGGTGEGETRFDHGGMVVVDVENVTVHAPNSSRGAGSPLNSAWTAWVTKANTSRFC